MIDAQLRRDPISAGELLATIRSGQKLKGRNYVGEYIWLSTKDQRASVESYWRSILIRWDRKKHI